MSRLPTAVLGRTGLEVTRLGYGTALYRWEEPAWTRDRAVRLYNSVVDAGINFIDTAYDYVFAEEWISSILSPRYGEIHLATKGGCTDSRPEKNSSEHEWTRDNLFRGLEVSLRRPARATRRGRESLGIRSEVHSDPSGDPHDHRGHDEAGAPGGEPGRREERSSCGQRIRGVEEAARLGRRAGGAGGLKLVLRFRQVKTWRTTFGGRRVTVR